MEPPKKPLPMVLVFAIAYAPLAFVVFFAQTLLSDIGAWSARLFGDWAAAFSVVPVFAILMIPGWLFAHWWRPHFDRYHRYKNGKCMECGYDLRAHHAGQRCPECGTAIPSPQNSS
jgi:hypothetical protein